MALVTLAGTRTDRIRRLWLDSAASLVRSTRRLLTSTLTAAALSTNTAAAKATRNASGRLAASLRLAIGASARTGRAPGSIRRLRLRHEDELPLVVACASVVRAQRRILALAGNPDDSADRASAT